MHTFIFLVLIKNINGGGSWNITPMPNTDVCVQVLRTIESHGGRGFGILTGRKFLKLSCLIHMMVHPVIR
ncbi:hypothetical protein ACYKUC_00995 [Escherichia coli]